MYGNCLSIGNVFAHLIELAKGNNNILPSHMIKNYKWKEKKTEHCGWRSQWMFSFLFFAKVMTTVWKEKALVFSVNPSLYNLLFIIPGLCFCSWKEQSLQLQKRKWRIIYIFVFLGALKKPWSFEIKTWLEVITKMAGESNIQYQNDMNI